MSVKTLLQLAAALTLLAFGVGAAVLSWDAHKFIHHADAALIDARGEWQNEKIDIHSILSSARQASASAAALADEQRIQLKKTSRDSDNQVRAIGLVTRNAEEFFYHPDQEVNGHVLPDFDRELVSTSTAAQFSFESLTKASDALTFQINDPATPQMLQAYNDAAHGLACASENASSALGHVDHTFAYCDKQLTTPLGFWKTLGKTVLSTGSQAGNIYAGFIK